MNSLFKSLLYRLKRLSKTFQPEKPAAKQRKADITEATEWFAGIIKEVYSSGVEPAQVHVHSSMGLQANMHAPESLGSYADRKRKGEDGNIRVGGQSGVYAAEATEWTEWFADVIKDVYGYEAQPIRARVYLTEALQDSTFIPKSLGSHASRKCVAPPGTAARFGAKGLIKTHCMFPYKPCEALCAACARPDQV
jgi:hypothetical protein